MIAGHDHAVGARGERYAVRLGHRGGVGQLGVDLHDRDVLGVRPVLEPAGDRLGEQVGVLGGGQGREGAEAGKRHRPILTRSSADGHPGFTRCLPARHLRPVC